MTTKKEDDEEKEKEKEKKEEEKEEENDDDDVALVLHTHLFFGEIDEFASGPRARRTGFRILSFHLC